MRVVLCRGLWSKSAEFIRRFKLGKMAKRGAQSDLNHDNWNEEEESEEAGRFAQAPDDELKKRVIKTARRRGVGGTDSGSSGSSVFGGFKGFSGVTSTPAVKPAAEGGAASSPFSFLSGIAKPTNGTSGTTTTAAATTSSLGASIFAATDPSKKVFSGFGSPPKESKESGDEEYAANVKALNLAVSAWISEKVKENPLCKLTPIFKDYDKYLDEIEAKKSSNKPVTKESSPAKMAAPASGFTFGSVAPATATAPAPAAKPFSFGFGSTAGTTSSTPGTGFSFANVAKPAEDSSKSDEKAAEDEDDEPPKVEFTPVEEKDSIYSKRCKLFVKADGNFSDRGIGTLHIKKVDTKVQVLVRADTSLGQILLNIILNEAVPVQRMGKNNVMMVCVPTPETKPPPTSVLLRVKTGEEADELYETLIKHKPK